MFTNITPVPNVQDNFDMTWDMIKIFKIIYLLYHLTKIIRMRNGVICIMWMWLMFIDVAKTVQEVKMSDCLSKSFFDEYVCSWLIIHDITGTQTRTAYYTNPRISGVVYDHYKLISAATEGDARSMAPDGFLIMHIDKVYGPLTRYVKLQVAHALGIPGTFSPAADFKGNR